MTKKMNKKTVKSQNKRVTKNNIIIVKNADGDPDTTAEIIVQNKISYKPRVSVIIPVYNVEKYLPQCLDSVVNQTLPDIEIICVDDGSTDSSLDILKDYARRDKRITVLRQKNMRAGIARNAALTVAKGKYIHFLDSDDWVDVHTYETVYACIERNSSDMAVFCWNNVTEYDRAGPNSKLPFAGCVNVSNENIPMINPEIWNKLYKIDILNKYKIRFPHVCFGEDTNFNMQYLCVIKTAYYIDNKLYNYRINNESLVSQVVSGRGVHRLLESIKGYKYSIAFIKKQNLFEEKLYVILFKLSSTLNNFICKFLPLREYRQAFEYIRKEILKPISKSYYKNFKLLLLIANKKYNEIIHVLGLSDIRNFNFPRKYVDVQKIIYKNMYIHLLKENKIIKDRINLTFILDAGYFYCTYVAIASIINSKLPTTALDINIIYTHLTWQQRLLLGNLSNVNINIYLIRADNTKFNGIKNVYHVTNTALIKFDLPNILSDVEKTLYIDGDILVQKDLSDLYNIELGDNYIAAIRELRAEKMGFAKNVGSDYYINSGVMLMNLKKMREMSLTDVFIEVKTNQPDTWKCMDQDVINYVCNKNILFLPPIYNDTIGIFLEGKVAVDEINNFYHTDYKSLKDLYNKSYIIHFAGKLKPWLDKGLAKNITNDYLDVAKHLIIKDNFIQKKHANNKDFLCYLLFLYNLFALWYLRIKRNRVENKKLYSRRYMVDLINQNHAAVLGAVADINRRCDTLQRQLDGMKSGIIAANSETQNNILARISEFSDEIRNVVTDGTASVLDMADVMRESSKKIAHSLEKHVTDNVRNVSDTVHTTLHGGIVQLDGRIASIHAVVKDSANLLNKKLHKSVDNARDELNTKITDMGNAVNVSVATASKNMTDAVDNMRHGMGDQISALNSEITTAVSAVGDAVQRNQSELSLRDSEQYWAHVYHDTISNSSWLNNKSVSPGRWAVSYIVLYVLYRVLDEMRPTSILECGLGQSSKLTIQYARATGAKLMICENNPDWLNFFARQMPDAPDYTTILDAVNVQIVPPYESRTYHGFSDAIGKTKFNLVLIDGPRGSDHYSRPEILDIVDNLDTSFVILLDDMNRIGEQETWRMLREKLKSRGIDFREGRYTSDKGLGIICSPDLAFLTSM